MMGVHPIMESPGRWVPALFLALVAVGMQAALLIIYAGAEPVSAVADGALSVGLFCGLAYLSWYVIGFVSLVQTHIIVSALVLLFWLAGSFVIEEWILSIQGGIYVPFSTTLPFRALFGVLAWGIVMMWYRLLFFQKGVEQVEEERELLHEQQHATQCLQEPEEIIDRITIKDGSRIHIIPTDKLLYIQACGDYVTLFTTDKQFVKEQTMKYLETHLPASGFVRIHRSTIVNVTQISRVELFGKENYRLLLKNGSHLRVSLSGYRLLKERLSL